MVYRIQIEASTGDLHIGEGPGACGGCGVIRFPCGDPPMDHHDRPDRAEAEDE